MALSDIELRPHQKDAVTAAVRTLRAHARATVIAACGTGKTLIAARTSARLAAHGRVLVLVPTLDLLSQTARSWHAAGRKGRAVAVCSARQAIDHTPAGNLPMTTDPAELTTLTPADPGGPVTVYATYASLPTLLAAHHSHRLPAWDLAVVDEAHRTAGRLGKAWAAIHHDDQIPANRRLYLTATPRIWDPDNDRAEDPVASMDDETLYGPVAYRLTLSDAIDLGLLRQLRHHVVADRHRVLPRPRQRLPPGGEELLRRPGRRRDPKPAKYLSSCREVRSCCLFDLERWRSNADSRSGDPVVARA
ncbi:DEAD/DEAH box helicase family protein [Streptomyces sp. MS1.AVA.4]|uniref:DEAD/DEAH box helicase family protein n=1 Tax=Streptomyces pratisoli TaxID=3139917 RepID=A0ACC6Q9Q9_9ACTN